MAGAHIKVEIKDEALRAAVRRLVARAAEDFYEIVKIAQPQQGQWTGASWAYQAKVFPAPMGGLGVKMVSATRCLWKPVSPQVPLSAQAFFMNRCKSASQV